MTHKISEDGIVTFTGPDGNFSAPLLDLKATIDALLVDKNENEFIFNGRKFITVVQKGCVGCAFRDGEFSAGCSDRHRPDCASQKRADYNSVIWKLAKEPKKSDGIVDGYAPIDVAGIDLGGCSSCAFFHRDCQHMTKFPCTPSERADGRNIFWRKIDE